MIMVVLPCGAVVRTEWVRYLAQHVAPTKCHVNAGCYYYSLVAGDKSPTHTSLSCRRKSGNICFRRALEKRFKITPASQLASPWLQDLSDKLCGSKMAVCKLQGCTILTGNEKFFLWRFGRGPRGVAQFWPYTHPCHPGLCLVTSTE